MKKVCHITTVHTFDDVRILKKECISLSDSGFDVSLLACGDIYFEKTQDNVKLIVLQVDSKKRLQRMLKGIRKTLKKAIEIDAEIYHLHDPELIISGLILKKKGKIVIFDSHEDVPANILSKEWIWFPFRNIISKCYSIIEKIVFPKFDALVSVTPSLTERLKSLNPNTFQITNYPILDKKILDIEPKMYNSITFAGTVTPQWMHKNIIKAIQEIENMNYNIAGVSDKKYLSELQLLPAWEKVNYVGKLSFNEVSNFISLSTAGMALCDYSPNVGGKEGSLGNTKLFEYMMAGIPVICTDFVLWKEIIEKNDCGICVDPYDIRQISNAITTLMQNKEKAKAMGENGRKLVMEYYNWETQKDILIKMYNMFYMS